MPNCASYNGVMKAEQRSYKQLSNMKKRVTELSKNCPRYRDHEHENFIKFVFSVSRGLEMPDFFYCHIIDYTLRELAAADANYRETDPATLIRMLLEISIANALPDIIDDVNVNTAINNGKICAEYERLEFHKLYLKICNFENNDRLSDSIITPAERSSLNEAINLIVGSSLMSSSVPAENDGEAIEELQKLLTEEDITNNSSIDLLLVMRRVMNPDQVSVIAQAAKKALPVVTKLSEYYQRKSPAMVHGSFMKAIFKLTKAMTAAAGLVDDQDRISEY